MRKPDSISVLTFWRCFSLRHARQEWLQSLLLLVILGLGVGTFLSIRIANRAAVEGFQLFTESLNGPSDWIVESAGSGIPVEELAGIREALGGIPAALYPVVEGLLHEIPEDWTDPRPTRPVRLLGLDLVQLRSVTGEADGQEDFWSILDDPEHLLVTREVADRWSVREGDRATRVIGGRETGFTIRGILPAFRDGTPLPRNLAVVDLRALLNRFDSMKVDRVEIVVPDGQMRDAFVAEAGERLQAALVGSLRVTSPSGKEADGASMTAAFRLNLTVLSLIALLVGMYLIAQTLDATVSRRRPEIAALRSLGVSPADIYRLWMSEAVLYGIAAALAGLLLGWLMASVTVDAVTTTVRALYRDTVQTATGLTAADVLLAFALGIGGSLVAAWLPARDAAGTPPAQFLRMGKRIPPFPIFRHTWLGFAALAAGGLLLLAPPWEPAPGSRIPVAGYATAFLWLTGGTLVAAGSIKWIGRILHASARDNARVRLAGSRLQQPTSRHQLALSGFFVAIGMASAMAFLINSFEHTVTGWLQQRLRADLFISSVGFQGSDADQRMPGALLDRIAREPGVAEVDRFRSVEVRVNGIAAALGGSRFNLLGSQQQLLWIGTPVDDSESPPRADAVAYVNENMVSRTGLKAGDTFTVSTPDGEKTLWIGGVHADYARDNGLILIDLPLLESWYPIDQYDTAAVFLEDGTDPGTLQESLRAEFPGLAIRQNGELMETALFIFNQTFAVTRALQLIGLVVALAGLSLSLLSLLRESGKELSLQRTLGMSRHEIAMTTAMEGMGIAIAGLFSGVLLSVALGYVLIFVINRQSFGWTLQTAFPWTDLGLLASGVLVLGLATSYLTGRLYLRKWRQEPL